MDFTPLLQSKSEDSGCLLTSSDASSAVHTGESASTDSGYNETPTTASLVSRKRKLCYFNSNKNVFRESSFESPATFANESSSKIFSSTLNESLSKSLEKCNLGGCGYTPNFYVEHSVEDEHSMKRYKLDDSPTYQPKTRSAPSTPTKHLEEEELCCTRNKSRSEQLDGTHLKAKAKLGSIERVELLYPNLKPTPSPCKLKTPEKLRDFLKKINSPAKKRLFEGAQAAAVVERRVFKKVDYDPISVFVVKNDFRHIVSKIFEYLSESDLCTVSRVSKSWKKALMSDHKAFPRYYSYSQEFNSNKENVLRKVMCEEKASPPGSPARDSFHRCTRIASQLLPTQSLQKCIRCMEPAVLQRNISQCQNPNCEYIYCTRCLSFSISGPEHFVDKCQASELVIDKQKAPSRFGLYDISNGGNDPPAFLMNDSFNTPQSRCDSSGYMSGNDLSPVMRRVAAYSSQLVKSAPILRSINRSEMSVAHRRTRRSSLVSVVSSNATPKIVEIVEPSSPPKVELVACSKKSKRNLKRLRF